ncbi:MAG: hypothetical protein K0S35_3859, partial [Geminicoccaceae bacterium]|nr:hypothetical protein [Geminicoccaceae bacterium]
MGATLVLAATVAAEPYVPTDDSAVLERLPSPDDPRLQKLRVLADSLSDRPEDLELALDVARRYVALGTAEGDPRYFGLAQGALRAWWEEPEPPAGVRLVRAAVRRAQHDFDSALADLDAVLAANPSHAQAHLDRAALLEALGDFLEAERACYRVARLRPGLVAEACMASAGSLSGMAGPSYEALLAALETETRADAGGRLWALTILGEIAARRGDGAAAERHFTEALALGRRDVYLLWPPTPICCSTRPVTGRSRRCSRARAPTTCSCCAARSPRGVWTIRACSSIAACSRRALPRSGCAATSLTCARRRDSSSSC